MTIVGDGRNFVDTQGVLLENTDDSKMYRQLTNIDFQIDSNVTKHQLTDDTIDNVYSLNMNWIEAHITLTTPEVPDLVLLTVDVNGKRPSKNWELSMNDSSDATKKLTITGQIKTLRVIDTGISVAKLFIRIEGGETVSVT